MSHACTAAAQHIARWCTCSIRERGVALNNCQGFSQSFNMYTGTKCLQNRCQLITLVCWAQSHSRTDLHNNLRVCTNFQEWSGMIIYQNRKQKLANSCFLFSSLGWWNPLDHMWFISTDFIGIPHCLDGARSPEGRASIVFGDIIT